MMKILIMMMTLIPLLFAQLKSANLMFQFVYLLTFMITLTMNFNNYFSNISYNFGLDLYSYGLMLMTLIIGALMIISMLNYHNFKMFLMVNFTLITSLFFIFTSLSFMYMYIYFEFALVPLLILILGWGYQPERLLAGVYLFMYTFLVSLPVLFIMVYIYMIKGSMFFDYLIFENFHFMNYFIFMLVFLVKFPMYLFHFWLPKAHVQAPVSGSMILAAMMLKIGGYGLIRMMNLFEFMFMKYSFTWFTVSMIGSVVISMICLIQADMKCMIAYSSISHMSLVIMGLMTMNFWGIMGSYYLMLGHGFCSSALFYVSNLFYNRTGSRSFFINSGLISFMPSCGLFFFSLCSFNMSCPPSLNFFSELMIIPSMLNFWSNSFYYFTLMSFLCACFSYYLYSFTLQGMHHNMFSFSSMNIQEFLCILIHLAPLIGGPMIFMSMI